MSNSKPQSYQQWCVTVKIIAIGDSKALQIELIISWFPASHRNRIMNKQYKKFSERIKKRIFPAQWFCICSNSCFLGFFPPITLRMHNQQLICISYTFLSSLSISGNVLSCSEQWAMLSCSCKYLDKVRIEIKIEFKPSSTLNNADIFCEMQLKRK